MLVKSLRTFGTNVHAFTAVAAPAALATYCLSHAQPRSVQAYVDGALNFDHWLCLEFLVMFAGFHLCGMLSAWFNHAYLNMPRQTHARRPVQMLVTLTFVWVYIAQIRPELHSSNVSVMGFTHGESPVNDILTPYIRYVTMFLSVDNYTRFFAFAVNVYITAIFHGYALHFCGMLTTFVVDTFARVFELINPTIEKMVPGWFHIDLCDYCTGCLNLFAEFLAWILADLVIAMACGFGLGGFWRPTEFNYWCAMAAVGVIRAIPHISYTTKTVRKNTTPRAKRTVVAAAPKEE